MKRFISAFLFICAALIFCSCGDGNINSTSSETGSTEAEYYLKGELPESLIVDKTVTNSNGFINHLDERYFRYLATPSESEQKITDIFGQETNVEYKHTAYDKQYNKYLRIYATEDDDPQGDNVFVDYKSGRIVYFHLTNRSGTADFNGSDEELKAKFLNFFNENYPEIEIDKFECTINDEFAENGYATANFTRIENGFKVASVIAKFDGEGIFLARIHFDEDMVYPPYYDDDALIVYAMHEIKADGKSDELIKSIYSPKINRGGVIYDNEQRRYAIAYTFDYLYTETHNGVKNESHGHKSITIRYSDVVTDIPEDFVFPSSADCGGIDVEFIGDFDDYDYNAPAESWFDNETFDNERNAFITIDGEEQTLVYTAHQKNSLCRVYTVYKNNVFTVEYDEEKDIIARINRKHDLPKPDNDTLKLSEEERIALANETLKLYAPDFENFEYTSVVTPHYSEIASTSVSYIVELYGLTIDNVSIEINEYGELEYFGRKIHAYSDKLKTAIEKPFDFGYAIYEKLIPCVNKVENIVSASYIDRYVPTPMYHDKLNAYVLQFSVTCTVITEDDIGEKHARLTAYYVYDRETENGDEKVWVKTTPFYFALVQKNKTDITQLCIVTKSARAIENA